MWHRPLIDLDAGILSRRAAGYYRSRLSRGFARSSATLILTVSVLSVSPGSTLWLRLLTALGFPGARLRIDPGHPVNSGTRKRQQANQDKPVGV